MGINLFSYEFFSNMEQSIQCKKKNNKKPVNRITNTQQV